MTCLFVYVLSTCVFANSGFLKSFFPGKSSALQNNMVPVFRISTTFGETFSYDAVDLRRVDVETCKVLLTICGRNRVTTQGQPIASLSLPLAGFAKMTTPEWYPLMYKIVLPCGYDVADEQQALKGSRSWEEKGMYKEPLLLLYC